MRFRLPAVFSALLACFFLASAHPALSEDATVDAVDTKTGDTTVTAQGLGPDSRAALLAAKRDAVEKVAGAIIQSETEVRNFAVHRDRVLSRTSGAVKSYTVTSETKTTDGLTEVAITALVSTSDVNRELAALRILFETMDKPRVMVMLDERIGGSPSSVFQTELTKKLLEYGFNMVDTATVAAIIDKDDALLKQALAGETSAAVKVGLLNGAEVLILGSVKPSAGPKVYDLVSGQADVSISAVSCASGQVLASGTAHGAAVHCNLEAAQAEAVKKAAARIMERKKEGATVTSFFDKLVASWQDMSLNGIAIAVKVVNVKDFKGYDVVKQALEEADSFVVSVVQRGYARPEASYEVTYKGLSDTLARSLDGVEVEGLGVMRVSSMASGALTLELEGPDSGPKQDEKPAAPEEAVPSPPG
ncbi:MAG: hypothetical protein HZB23_06235 [Deltaproteobacteria bacterium]|nr:hypothetical protein [Deltaproteobacteria bacterium]